ncbi:MAG: spermine synthase, partial [Frankiales bacterium]|nr:spermine synthase [Frankiales bacterium]
DVIVCDVFSGARIPPHVTTAEFAAQAARVLRPDGIYAANVGDGGALGFTRGQVATLLSVFPHVALIGDPGVLRGRRFGNLVLAASPRPLPELGLRRLAARASGTARVVTGPELVAFTGGAPVVTDATVGPTPTPPPDLFAP